VSSETKKSERSVSEGVTTQQLTEVLSRAKDVGFLGPGPVAEHIEHAERFGRALLSSGPAVGRFVDIGAGGGVPGLVLLSRYPTWSGVLLDAAQRRCSFLVWALAALELQDRAEVWCGRAEEIGHERRAREQFEAVVARGFGPPASTLECAAPLVAPNGVIVISEPPTPRRWPDGPLAELALRQLESEPSVAVFARADGLASRYPRRAKEQQREPLFELD
jgi:16S rRNA (guanine527-N7)-methyltransferase